MPKMNPVELHQSSHLIMSQKVQENFRRFSHVFEVRSHGVTIDTNPSFRNICKTYKEAMQRHLPVELWKINNTTGRRTREYINPLLDKQNE